MVGEGNIMCGMELCTQGTVMTVHERLCACVSVYMCARMCVRPTVHVSMRAPALSRRSHPFPLQVSCSEAAVHSCLSDCVVVQSWLITLIVC